MTTPTLTQCGDCAVYPGQPHESGCDVARCLHTGRQRLSCNSGHECHGELEDRGKYDAHPDGSVSYHYHDPLCRFVGCDPHDCGEQVWTGRWPGDAECEEFGWYSYFGPRGWVECGPDHPEAGYDLNRLAREAVWDRQAQRWRKRVSA